MCEKVIVTHTYKWSIENFSLKDLKNERLIPKVFDYKMELNSAKKSTSSSWSLNFYPNGFDDESMGHVCFEITLKTYNGSNIDTIEIPMRAEFKLSILKDSGEETNSHHAAIHFDSEDTALTRRLFRNFIKLDSILDPANGLLANDKLTLLFSIGIQEGSSIITMEESTYKSRLQLSDNLEYYCNCKNLSDVTLVVRGKEFKANKIILAARSPVFSSMFSVDMKEKNNDSVKIDDIDPKVFKEMLKFMYSGKLQKYQFVEELLVVADQYEVKGLQEVCEKYLCNNVRINNAMDLLQLADSYNAYDLKQHALDYIVEHAQHVIETDGFNNMQQPQVHLMKKLFCALVKHTHDDIEKIRHQTQPDPELKKPITSILSSSISLS